MIFFDTREKNELHFPVSELLTKENVMIGKITNDGLEIKRGSEWKKQYCPFGDSTKVQGQVQYVQCGSNCPVFEEPVEGLIRHGSKITRVTTCYKKSLEFEVWYDERT